MFSNLIFSKALLLLLIGQSIHGFTFDLHEKAYDFTNLERIEREEFKSFLDERYLEFGGWSEPLRDGIVDQSLTDYYQVRFDLI